MIGESIDKLVIQIKADVDDALKGINEVKGDLSRLEDRTNKSSKSMVNLANVIKAASIAAVAALGALSWKMVNLASDAEEVNSKFDVVFSGMENSVAQWAKEFSMNIGRSTTEVKKFMSEFQDILDPMEGMSTEAAADFSKTLTQLAVDLASFNNVADADAAGDLISALIGQSEPILKYGIILNVAKINQELLNMGIAGGTKVATEAQIAHARLNIILRSSTTAQGDAARTADAFANQMRTLKSRLNDVMVEAGDEALDDLATTMSEFDEWGRNGGYDRMVEGLGDVAKVFAMAAKAGSELAQTLTDIYTVVTIQDLELADGLSVEDELFPNSGSMSITSDFLDMSQEEQLKWMENHLELQEQQRIAEEEKKDAIDETTDSIKKQNEAAKQSTEKMPGWAGKSDYIADMLDESNKQLDSNYGTEGYGTKANKRKYQNIDSFEQLTEDQLDNTEWGAFGSRWVKAGKEETVSDLVSEASNDATTAIVTPGPSNQSPERWQHSTQSSPDWYPPTQSTPIPQPIVQLPQSVPIMPNSPIWNSTNSGDVISKLSEIGQIQKDGNTNVDDGNATLLNILTGIKNIERNTSNRSSGFSRIIRDDIDTGA